MSNVFCGIRSEYTSVTLLLNVNINLIVLKGGKRHACSSVEEYGLLGCNVYSSEITRRFEGTCRFHLHSLQAKPPALVAFFFAWLTFWPWRRRRYVTSKRPVLSELHGVITHHTLRSHLSANLEYNIYLCCLHGKVECLTDKFVKWRQLVQFSNYMHNYPKTAGPQETSFIWTNTEKCKKGDVANHIFPK